MKIENPVQLSKTDFLLYLDAPRHLWAKAHGLLSPEKSAFELHLAQEGMAVEALAWEYLREYILPQHPKGLLSSQEVFRDGPYTARTDALLCGLEGGGCALFEIKSSTSIDTKKLIDACFQALILRQVSDLCRVYLLHLNKDYRRKDKLELQELFICEEISERIANIETYVLEERMQALAVLQETDMHIAEACYKPSDCPCPQLCHPDLPRPSIYEIPYLKKEKKAELRNAGLVDIQAVPDGYPLSSKQSRIVQVLKSKTPYCDQKQLRSRLENLSWPLWFLDYETCIAAVPRYPGYAPQQQIVFQYSLHKLSSPHAKPEHFEELVLGPDDPSKQIVESLQRKLGSAGTVLVWNQGFEMTRNRELAALHPEYAPFLEALNARVFDLMLVVSDGLYIHPEFMGSASIKYVLPVMVPELSYETLNIQIGDQASAAWQKSCESGTTEKEREEIRQDLLEYCHLDTLAMLKIYRRLRSLAGMEDA